MIGRRCSKTESSRRGTGAPTLALLVAVAGPVAAPALARNPVFLFAEDRFRKPNEFSGAWVRLFNGKDLAGWKPHGAERWVVDKGEILGEALTKEYGYLSTESTYRDFELKVKFKAEGTGNSGVFFHSSLDGVDIAGVQAEVDPRPGMHTGGLYEAAGREWLVKPAAAAENALRIGGWNDMRILVRGPHVRTWVNGVPAVDYVDPSPKYTDGVIALQLHAGGEGRMRFKGIVIREIK